MWMHILEILLQFLMNESTNLSIKGAYIFYVKLEKYAHFSVDLILLIYVQTNIFLNL